jgi:hypothetical protein
VFTIGRRVGRRSSESNQSGATREVSPHAGGKDIFLLDLERIAFTSARDGSFGVYTMAADGSDVADLSQTPLQHQILWAWLKY